MGLQIENQDSDIKVSNKEYNELKSVYDALCEGRRLNPCEMDSSNDNDNEEQTELKESTMISEEKKNELMKEWESKLMLSDNPNIVNNNGFIEKAADGQFDDVTNEDNPYLDANLISKFDEFAPQQNKTFENKFMARKDIDVEADDCNVKE